jgi:hypothetical protein
MSPVQSTLIAIAGVFLLAILLSYPSGCSLREAMFVPVKSVSFECKVALRRANRD